MFVIIARLLPDEEPPLTSAVTRFTGLLLVTVMDVAGDEDGEHHPGQHDGGDGIVTQP